MHATVAAELESLTAAHPVRERFWALRALALLRSRRQADALEVLREVRELLVEELGLEPGPELRDLQAAVLRQDPALEWVPPAEPVAAVAVAATRERRRPTGAPLVGRDDELASLLDSLDLAESGTPAYVALTGDPGIGKTRLATELIAAASGRGVTVLTGRCSQDDGAPPLWPWAAVLAGLGKEVPVSQPGDREDDGAQFRSWESMARTVIDATSATAVLVVLDDLHWADVSSLRVLRLVAETAQNVRLMVLTTWRAHPEPTGALADVAETFARRHAVRLQLSGLDADQAAKVVEAVAQSRPSDREAQALAQRTDGNPFFLVEYARLAGERGDLTSLLDEEEPPTAVHDVLVRRIARLPDETRDVLRPASVIGREFDTDTLAAVTGRDDDTLLDLLEPAQAAGLVREDGIDRWVFAHALVRDTLYAGLPASRRARMHAKVAGALEAPGRETERARHWLSAGPSAAAQAWAAAVAAAASTRRLHAHEQSADLLNAALSAMDDDPAVTGVDRYEVLMQLIDAYRWSGDWGPLIEAELTAVRVARDVGDVERVATAASAMTLGLWQSAPFGSVNPDIVAALRWCLDRLPVEDSRARCHTLLSLANEQYFDAPFDERKALIDEALAMARRMGDAALLLDALLIAHIALFVARTAHERLAWTTEAVELAESIGSERLVVAATLRATVQAEVGHVDAMRASAAVAQREASRLRHRFALVILEALELPWLAMAGRLDAGEQRLQQMERLLDLMGRRNDDDNILTWVSLALWRGTSEDIAARLAESDGGPIPFSSAVAVCYLRAGALDEARAYVAEHPIDIEHDTWLSLMVWCYAAEASLGLGDAALAARTYAVLAPYAGHSSGAGAHNASGPVDAFLACAAAATGSPDRAAVHADRAQELIELWQVPLVATWLKGLRERYRF
jgi:hypothetical protein